MKKTLRDYPALWRQVAQFIKFRNGWRCMSCGLQFAPDAYFDSMLSISSQVEAVRLYLIGDRDRYDISNLPVSIKSALR